MLVPLRHDLRAPDPTRAAALLRACGAARVRVTAHNARGWMLRDAPSIQRALAALEPETRSTIAFECITRDETLPELAALVAADSEYVHLAGNGATLRVWPARDEAVLDQIAIGRTSAFARFRAACATTWINGYVTAPGAAAAAALRRALAVVDQPEVDFDLDLTVDAAAALVAAHPSAELEWAGADAIIQFPGGAIATFRTAPVDAADAAAWHARIAAAVAAST
jgi:hypothetical protein